MTSAHCASIVAHLQAAYQFLTRQSQSPKGHCKKMQSEQLAGGSGVAREVSSLRPGAWGSSSAARGAGGCLRGWGLGRRLRSVHKITISAGEATVQRAQILRPRDSPHSPVLHHPHPPPPLLLATPKLPDELLTVGLLPFFCVPSALRTNVIVNGSSMGMCVLFSLPYISLFAYYPIKCQAKKSHEKST